MASSAKTVLVDPRLGSAVARGLSGLDVVAFSKWLQSAKGVMELTLTAAEWERFDPGDVREGETSDVPGASQVASALPPLGRGSVKWWHMIKGMKATLEKDWFGSLLSPRIYNLRLLDLSHNGLTDQSATNLADVLSRSSMTLSGVSGAVCGGTMNNVFMSF